LLEKGDIFRSSHLKPLKRGRWRGVVRAWEKQRKEEGWEEAEECRLGKTGEEKRERETKSVDWERQGKKREREKLFEPDNLSILNFFLKAVNSGWLTR